MPSVPRDIEQMCFWQQMCFWHNRCTRSYHSNNDDHHLLKAASWKGHLIKTISAPFRGCLPSSHLHETSTTASFEYRASHACWRGNTKVVSHNTKARFVQDCVVWRCRLKYVRLSILHHDFYPSFCVILGFLMRHISWSEIEHLSFCLIRWEKCSLITQDRLPKIDKKIVRCSTRILR